MSNVRVITGLTEPEVFFIIDELAKVGSPQRIKRMFDTFFAPKSLDPNLIIEIAASMATRVQERRARYPLDSYDDIPIASTRCQLIFLQDLYDLCCEDREVGVNAAGEPIFKADYPTARKCVETSNQIVEREKIRKLKEKELETGSITMSSNSEDGEENFMLQVIHSDNEDAPSETDTSA